MQLQSPFFIVSRVLQGMDKKIKFKACANERVEACLHTK